MTGLRAKKCCQETKPASIDAVIETKWLTRAWKQMTINSRLDETFKVEGLNNRCSKYDSRKWKHVLGICSEIMSLQKMVEAFFISSWIGRSQNLEVQLMFPSQNNSSNLNRAPLTNLNDYDPLYGLWDVYHRFVWTLWISQRRVKPFISC